MKFTIKGKNIEVTDAIVEAIEDSLSGLDKYFQNKDVEAHVVVRTYPVGQKVEVTLFVDTQLTIRQEVLHEDLYAAIDLVGKKLEQQIRKYKDRVAKQCRDGETIAKYLVPEEFDVEEEQHPIKITKRKELENKPMTEDEALLQFELVGHDFYVFDDYEDDRTKIIYKRHEGDYGIIEITN